MLTNEYPKSTDTNCACYCIIVTVHDIYYGITEIVLKPDKGNLIRMFIILLLCRQVFVNIKLFIQYTHTHICICNYIYKIRNCISQTHTHTHTYVYQFSNNVLHASIRMKLHS